jgi:hypothetical protein
MTFIQSSAMAVPYFAYNTEAYLYVGITVFSLALLGMVFGRSRAARLVKWLLLFSATFAVAGFLALALYRFPLMSNFRHIAHTAVVARFFLCLLSGYGAQLLLDSAARNKLISSLGIMRIPLLVALFFCFSLPLPAIWSGPAAAEGRLEVGPGTELVILSLTTGLICGLGIWAAARFLPPRRATVGMPAVMLGTLLVSAGSLTGKIFERETWSVAPQLLSYIREAINTPLGYVPVRGAADPEMEQFLRGLSSQGTRYDTMDSMLSRDAPATGERSDVIPERTHILLKIKRDAPEAYRFFTMQNQPKVFLAEHPEELNPKDDLKPGDVPLEIEGHEFVTKRKDVTNIAVKDFSFNRVSFGFPAGESGPGAMPRRFLVYMDSWHPEWSASVRGRPAKIGIANVAFKAVELPHEAGEVSFRFGSGLRHALAVLNAIAASASVVLQVAGLFLVGGVFVRRAESAPEDHPGAVDRA